MAYENTKIVKTLRFPGDTSNQYQINAVALSGLTREAIEQRFTTIESFDALRYMGTLAAGASLPSASKGDVYKVTSKGTIANAAVEVGDMLICNKDDTAANTPANWDIIQSNIDVDAIMDHYHTGTVTFGKSDKTLEHTVTPNKETLTATFNNGAASVTGNHGHTASGSVAITPGGSIQDRQITPKGTVKLTKPTTAGANDVTFTPSGTLGNATTVVDVQGGSTTVSAHVASSSEAGGHTPKGTVSFQNTTAGGSVAAHAHSVRLTKTDGSTASFFNTASYTAGATDMDGIITFGTASAVTACDAYSVSEDEVAPTFTGVAHTHDATFAGTAVAAHTHGITVNDHDAFVPVINPVTEAHTHTFTGNAINVAAQFTGTAESHNHDFTGTNATHNVTVNVTDFTGNFTGTATGTVTPSVSEVLTGVTIGNHTISTVDSGSFTTGAGTQQ